MVKNICFVLLTVFLFNLNTSAQRTVQNFNSDWRFILANPNNAESPNFDDNNWRQLNLPHDWSIEGDFSDKHPATFGGGALPGGLAWYRKTFQLDIKQKNKNFFIDFDGVYRNSEVWINGHYLGKRPNGYTSFRYDMTTFLKFGNEKNTIAVKVDNSEQDNSRWYSGSGIYRNVFLVSTEKVFVDYDGTYITTPEITAHSAKVHLEITLKNKIEKAGEYLIQTLIYDAANKEVAKTKLTIRLEKSISKIVNQDFSVNTPQLWTIEKPTLYSAVTQIIDNGKVIDSYKTDFGIRSFEFSIEKGFILNGIKTKINGVCNHHDLGCLGAAINTRALERQLEILKAMGCNGIRTSHNPPAKELLDLCDKMGFIVMDEAFDMWKKTKTKFDYGLDFDKWHKQDLQDFIRRDRNHASVFIWSIGNEIPEQDDVDGSKIGGELAGLVRQLDRTRAITSAMDRAVNTNFIYRSDSLDLVGFNYHHQNYTDFPKNFPGKKLIATESVSALQTRGSYDMPSDSIRNWPVRWDLPFTTGNADLTCSAYDNVHAPWGCSHEDSWKIIKKNDFVSGQYIWTGFDYLGEPTPYVWPARSSYFGIIDLAGFPKDVYYMYQSEWTNKDVLHIFPHWNWTKGDSVDVWAYSNSQEVELFLNGKSLGTKQKKGDELHLMWRVKYEPGRVKAIARTNKKVVLEQEIKTAGEAAKMILSADRSDIKADGIDLSFVTVTIVDKDGNTVPRADNLVEFTIEGQGQLVGVDNGSPISHESFKATNRKAYFGKCLAVLQSKKKTGTMVLKATAKGLQTATISIQLK